MWFDFAAARAAAAGAPSPIAPSDTATTSHDQAGAIGRRRSGAHFIRLLRKDPYSITQKRRTRKAGTKGRVTAPRPSARTVAQPAAGTATQRSTSKSVDLGIGGRATTPLVNQELRVKIMR
jgi:hypothetical protein